MANSPILKRIQVQLVRDDNQVVNVYLDTDEFIGYMSNLDASDIDELSFLNITMHSFTVSQLNALNLTLARMV